jgi:Tfp pilus assembly protein FimT
MTTQADRLPTLPAKLLVLALNMCHQPARLVILPVRNADSTMRGFSLPQLVIVIALAGILATVAISFTPSLPNARLDVAAKQVLSDIEYAKQNAMLTGQTSGVQFISGGAYTVYQGTTATPLLSPLTQVNMVVTLSATYSGVSLSTNFTVEFDRFGSPTAGGGGSVSITNGTTTKTISVTANTGELTLQ